MDATATRLMMGAAGLSGDSPVEYVTTSATGNVTSSSNRTLTLTGLSAGDVVIGMISNRSSSAPATSSGYISITTNTAGFFGNYRSIRLQYKVVTGSSETMSWLGYGGLAVAYRNFTGIGQVGNYSSTFPTSSVPTPAMSSLDTSGRGLVFVVTYAIGVINSISSPYTVRFNTWGAAANNTLSSISSKTMGLSASVYPVSTAIEIL